MRRPLFLVSACLTLLVGCHKDNDNKQAAVPEATTGTGTSADFPSQNIQGVWNGTVSAGGQSTNATLTLSQSGNQVSGTLATPSGTTNVSGQVSGNSVTLTANPPPVLALPCTGTVIGGLNGSGSVSGNTLTLTFNGSTSGTVSGGGGIVARAQDTATNVISISTGTVTCGTTLTAEGVFTHSTSNASPSLTFGL